MKDYLKYIAVYVGVFLLIGVGAYVVSEMTEEVTLIEPEPGVKCAIVSRTFNTSIDCWKD